VHTGDYVSAGFLLWSHARSIAVMCLNNVLVLQVEPAGARNVRVLASRNHVAQTAPKAICTRVDADPLCLHGISSICPLCWCMLGS
jgi:hypothetical protein